MRTPHKGTLWENSVDTLERRWEVLVKIREQEPNCRRFDNTPGTQKHRATEFFNERHVLSALFCLGFLARCRLLINNTWKAVYPVPVGAPHPMLSITELKNQGSGWRSSVLI